MLLKIFTIRDLKGEIYNAPFFQRSHGEAERNFASLSTDGKSMVAQHPEDFDLYYLGLYNDQTGKIECLDTPQHVIKAVNVKPRQIPNLNS